MASIVALLDRLEDVDGVVLPLAIAGHIAGLGPLGRSWEQLARVFGTDGEVGPLGRDPARENVIRRRGSSKDGRSFEQRYREVGGEAHLVRLLMSEKPGWRAS